MSFDLTVHQKTLRRDGLRRSDFLTWPELQNEKKLQKLIEKAEKIGISGFKSLTLSNALVNRKITYKVTKLEDELVLRIVAKNIKRLTRARQSNRASIIQSLKALLEEGVEYRIYKLDVKSFYESLSTESILNQLANDSGFSRSALFLLASFFSELNKQGITGLPRGIALSATLAEFAMRNFDRTARDHMDVFFFSRFVDDIVIITSGRENPKQFIKSIRRSLPDGVMLHPQKQRIIESFERPLKAKLAPKISSNLDFLGYRFLIHARQIDASNLIGRRVIVDIAPSKANKIKTRIVKSAIQFCADGNFADFLDRLRLLSGNYTVYDHARGIKRKAGVFYNYRFAHIGSSSEIPELDSFLRRFIQAHDGKICSQLQKTLTNSQKRIILRLSFESSFRKRTFYHFQGYRLVELMECWSRG